MESFFIEKDNKRTVANQYNGTKLTLTERRKTKWVMKMKNEKTTGTIKHQHTLTCLKTPIVTVRQANKNQITA